MLIPFHFKSAPSPLSTSPNLTSARSFALSTIDTTFSHASNDVISVLCALYVHAALDDGDYLPIDSLFKLAR